jgi:putative transposase
VHFGHAATVRAHRQQVLAAAYATHPERFVKGRPQPAELPTAVWINPPVKKPTRQDAPGTTIVTAVDLQHPLVSRADKPSTTTAINFGASLTSMRQKLRRPAPTPSRCG